VTVGQLKADLLGRVEGNSVFYDAQELLDAINEANLIVQLMSGHRQVTVSLSRLTIAGRVFYRIPDGVLIPMAVYFEQRQLNRSALSAINRHQPDWMRRRTAQWGPVDQWIPIGTRWFAIYPGDSKGGHHIEVTGIAAPTDLTSDSDVLEIEDIWADTLREQAYVALVLGDGGQILKTAVEALRGDRSGVVELSRWKLLADPKLSNTVRVMR